MRKEILPEMFNYNKYPGPDFVYVADLLKSDACQFTVLDLMHCQCLHFLYMHRQYQLMD